jgi:transcriptional regulator with XRE-family HTH domain
MGLELGELTELKELGLHLAEVRLMRGLSQAELAHRCALAQTQISYFETGQRRPTLDQFFRLARALNVSIQRLISGADRPGTTLRDFAVELRHLGIGDLWIANAAVPAAIRRAEEVIPLAVAGHEPDPRILEAIPAVLAWNEIDPILLRAYALTWGSQTARRVAWLADIVLSILRKRGFPGGCQDKPLSQFVRSIRPPSAEQTIWDDLGRPMAELPTSPAWIRWKINYDASLAEFEKRAEQLAKLREQSGRDLRPRRVRVYLQKRGNN